MYPIFKTKLARLASFLSAEFCDLLQNETKSLGTHFGNKFSIQELRNFEFSNYNHSACLHNV